jgi:hypothetical protein
MFKTKGKTNKYVTQNMRLQRINADMRVQIKHLKEVIQIKSKIISAYKNNEVIDLTEEENRINVIMDEYDQLNANDAFLRLMNS